MLQMFVLALSLYNTWNRGVFLLCKITNLLIYSKEFEKFDYRFGTEKGHLGPIHIFEKATGTVVADYI